MFGQCGDVIYNRTRLRRARVCFCGETIGWSVEKVGEVLGRR